MKILVTGAKGFIGRNLVAELTARKCGDVLAYDVDSEPALLDQYTRDCNFVFHLAGVNRPPTPEEFVAGNVGSTEMLLTMLRNHNNRAPVLMSSSIQASMDNPYGMSKKAAEDLLFSYADEVDSKVLVYRLPNVFGKWCRPNYNSVIATFCYNVARDLPIQVNDPDTVLNFVYIDDVVEEFINALNGKENRSGQYCAVREVYKRRLGDIADLIRGFRQNRTTLAIPDMSEPFIKKLYSTYLSYLPTDQFAYSLKMNMDYRGSFTEIIRTSDRGQVSVNVTKPGITKGNHWHQTKSEKFVVVSGRGLVRFRRIGSDEVLEYFVSGEKLEALDIPPGYVHSICNIGDTDLVTFMWSSETYDPKKPDTYSESVMLNSSEEGN